MGLEIKRNGEGLYQVKCSMSDELIHDGDWVSEDEIKRVLIERKFGDFIDAAITVDKDFPKCYHVNNQREARGLGLGYIVDNQCNPGKLLEYADGLFKRLNLQLDFVERKTYHVGDSEMEEYLANDGVLFHVDNIDKYRSRDGYVVYTSYGNFGKHYDWVDGKYYHGENKEEVNPLLALYLKEAVSKHRKKLKSQLDWSDKLMEI